MAWINQGPMHARPLRLMQALALPLWPLRWQYQVYFVCKTESVGAHPGAIR
jgi:hypothetical protein